MTDDQHTSLVWPLTGVATAIAITTILDLSGMAMFTALVLLPIGLVFWWRQRLSRQEMGLTWGRPWHYGLALLYPLFVVGLATLAAWLAGASLDPDFDPQKLIKNMLLMSSIGIPMLVLTEEGFFRGWLWASLDRAGLTGGATLLWSSLAFSLWHWTWAIIDDGLALPAYQVPVYLGNAMVMGLGWGLLRWISGSVVVASVSHAVWNALAYNLFGAGPVPGVLGIERPLLFDAETGLIGLLLNLAFTASLWLWWQRSKSPE